MKISDGFELQTSFYYRGPPKTTQGRQLAAYSDEATLHVRDRQLIFDPVTSGNSKNIWPYPQRAVNMMREEFRDK